MSETGSKSWLKCNYPVLLHATPHRCTDHLLTSNILKDLNHEHIVRYHDRHVDRDAGILYILMEYCGGGDLSSVIKLAQRNGRPIPEETIWNYFMQILLALQYCHHPSGHSRSGSVGSDTEGRERRAPVLHRDLKPDNGVYSLPISSPISFATNSPTLVFLDESNIVKLGDFGLSKVLTQASLASTYVGVRAITSLLKKGIDSGIDPVLYVTRAHAREVV